MITPKCYSNTQHTKPNSRKDPTIIKSFLNHFIFTTYENQCRIRQVNKESICIHSKEVQINNDFMEKNSYRSKQNQHYKTDTFHTSHNMKTTSRFGKTTQKLHIQPVFQKKSKQPPFHLPPQQSKLTHTSPKTEHIIRYTFRHNISIK